MKFLHTADWQIGMTVQHGGGKGREIQEIRLEAARRSIRTATERGAEFILVAGDTFDDNGIERLLVQKVADILGEASVPVFVIPGNHDPHVPGSVWAHPSWRSAGNVRVLLDAKPVEIPGGILFPCPLKTKHSDGDPTAWISSVGEGGIRIGLAHGTVEGAQVDEKEFPIARDAAARSGLDYLALGHWHSTATFPSRDGGVRMAYSGTPEQTRFGERDSGNVLVVDIPRAGVPPTVEKFRAGALTWVSIDEEIRCEGDLARLCEKVEETVSPGRTLFDIKLSGLFFPGEMEMLERTREILGSRFFLGRLDSDRLRPAPDSAAWVDRLPPGIVREVARRLLDLTDPAYAGTRPEGATPSVAAKALVGLYAIIEEGRK